MLLVFNRGGEIAPPTNVVTHRVRFPRASFKVCSTPGWPNVSYPLVPRSEGLWEWRVFRWKLCSPVTKRMVLLWRIRHHRGSERRRASSEPERNVCAGELRCGSAALLTCREGEDLKEGSGKRTR